MEDTHRLRYMVHSNSPEITNDELNEIENKIDFDKCQDEEHYEFNGNFILTKDSRDWEDAKYHMCCGIVSHTIELSSGEFIHFAFDYGH